MKKTGLLLAAAIMAATTFSAQAFDLKNIFGSSDAKDLVGGLVEGVLTNTNLEVRDLAGVWTSDGSAVSFKSENLLNKAGGSAISSTIESKLNPYYKKFGLTGAVFTIQVDGSFTMQVKKITLQGNVIKNSDGTFNFVFNTLGKIKLGSVKVYAQRTSNEMDLMFDTSKLMTIFSKVCGMGGSTFKTIGNLLNSYDGMCTGFSLQKTGTVPGEDATNNNSVVSGLKSIFGGK